ncbi:MAG: hypothetical protein NXI10_17080 [bacterium]|nr:hypothetical protein [bacterium]
MLKFCVAFALCVTSVSWSQNHEENFSTIKTIEQAEDYASGFREVFTGIIHMEKDIFFFDDIDTSKLASYVGTMHSTIGKRTKLIDDSMFNIVNAQIIEIDYSDISPETAEILVGQMQKLLDRGDSFWDVKKRFSHTSAKFSSSPKMVQEITDSYAVTEGQMIEGQHHKWERAGEGVGFVVIDKAPHRVPGFYTISFLDRNSNF